MKTNEVLKKVIKDEIDGLIWAAREYAMETHYKDEFQAFVKEDEDGIVEVAIMFDEGKDGHLYTFDKESEKLDAEEYNYFETEWSRDELGEFEEVEL